MLILSKYIVRNIFENKVRSAIVLVIVVLASCVSIITLNLQQVVEGTYESVYRASIGDANITMEGQSDFNENQVNYGGVTVEKIERILTLYGKFIANGKSLKADIRGVDIQEYINMGSVNLLNNVKELQRGECVISAKTSKEYRLNTGDTVTVYVHSQPHEFTVAAIGESNKTFYEEKGNIQLLISLDDANGILGTENMISKLRLKAAGDTTDAVEKLRLENKDLSIAAGEEYDNLHFQMQTVSSSMLIVLCIIILVGGYIISSIAEVIVTDRIPIIGTFRSIGTDQVKIEKVLLMEFMAYGFIGTAIGIIAGMAGLPYVADLFNQYKEYGVRTAVSFNTWYFVIASGIGIFLPPAVALVSVKRVSKKNLKDVVLRVDDSKEIRKSNYLTKTIVAFEISLLLYFFNQKDNFIIGLLGISALIAGGVFLVQFILVKILGLFNKAHLLNGSAELGINNLKNNRFIRNNSSMIVVISMIFMIIATIINGIANTAQMDLDSYGFDMIAILNGDENVSEEDIASYQGVSGAYESYEVMAYGDYANGYCRVYGIDKFSELNQYMKALRYNGTDLDAKLSKIKNGIVIDQYWARVQNIKVGDKIKLYYDDKKTTKAADFVVADIWDCSKGTTDRVFVGISLDNYKRIFDEVPERILAITQSNPEMISDQIAEDYVDTDISVMTAEEFLSQQVATVNTILGILIASVILCGCVIIIGISSNLIVSFIQRKKEFATLYSVCMDMHQLKSMLIWETVASYVGIIITIVLLSVPIVMSIPKFTNGLGLIIDFNLNPSIMIGIMAAIFIILSLTVIGPIKKIGEMNIVKELKYE
ncbi:ABC-type lipoprotein release transport system permease subunit [Kineothrix alysoides]|uniref:ABC-type lipoprotein release transport system permease subunit n=1 Tax=Kineothrix alysoides TaxID=1469948 RepID=A0A4R1QYH3_9FIRM|nr:FtsX-like permease family protein [Kineothrix alysoides]TCL57590.1 ABC-type lipoprotein release transport system permease subunit [Kineothrix alysoides]